MPEPDDDALTSSFIAPQVGWLGSPHVAQPGSIIEVGMTQYRHGEMFDVESLRALIGDRLTVSAPARPITGVLRSVDAADDGLSVTLGIEVDRA